MIGMAVGTKVKESTIEKAVTQYAKARGWLSYKWLSFNQRGVPDRLFFKNGHIRIIEFKQPQGKLTALQSHVHQQLTKQGFAVHVVNNIDQGKEIFSG